MSRFCSRGTLTASTLALLVAGVAGVGCTDPGLEVDSTQDEIVGGVPATVGEYPTVAALVIGDGLCTGTLVAPNVIVTAAHCVSPTEVMQPNQAAVTLNTRVLFDTVDVFTSHGKEFVALNTIPEPMFANPGAYDIGIIVLATKVTDRNPSPVILDPSAVPPGSTVTLLGFGLTSASNQNSAGLLNVLSSKVTGDCTKLAAGASLTPPANNTNLICIDQTNGTGVCSGDSGSPAFFMTSGGLAVAGMTSFGDTSCDIVGAYTRLSAETAFFEAQMMAAGACAADGICTPACGQGTLPADPDCAPIIPDAGTGQSADAGGSGEASSSGGCTIVGGASATHGQPAGFALVLALGALVMARRRRA